MASLPQEFPRELALLRLDDVLDDLPDEAARQAYTAAFEGRRTDPLHPGGLVLVGPEPTSIRLLMALMRLTVLRFRDLNFERFEAVGGKDRLLTAYVRGENLRLPLPDRAGGLFVERADRAEPGVAGGLAGWAKPLYATWEGPGEGPVWEALTRRCGVLKV